MKGPITRIIDKYPGDITKGLNGEKLNGDETSPYEINCIEDLIDFSNRVRNEEEGTMYVTLKRSLSFTSIRSYTNYRTTKLGDINEDGKVESLMAELTTGTGFKAIGKKEYVQSTGFVALTGFNGVFDGLRIYN